MAFIQTPYSQIIHAYFYMFFNISAPQWARVVSGGIWYFYKGFRVVPNAVMIKRQKQQKLKQ